MFNAHPFLAAIHDSPDDDGPRLAFADWLEERGETARAEFLRVQCELARLPTSDPRYPGLHLRQLDLVAEHEADWLGEWAERLVRWEFRRGLLHSVTLTPQPFVSRGEHLFADHPVERVALVNERGESLAAEQVAEVVAAPAMREVRALEAAGCRKGNPMGGMYGGEVATSAWLAALAGAMHVTRLEELHLNGDTRGGRHPIHLEIWRRFCRSPHLRTLRRLDLSDLYTQDTFQALIEATRVLASASFVKNLRALSLASTYLGDEAAHHLADAPLVNLEDLDLTCCDMLSVEGLNALFSSPRLSRLRALGVPYAAPLPDLGRSPLLARLHSLHLQGNFTGTSTRRIGAWSSGPGRAVTENEWVSLFRSPHLHNLIGLTVDAHWALPPPAVVALLETPWAANLRQLTLSGQNLSAEHLAPLFARRVKGPTRLHALSVPDCEGLGQALAGWPGMAGITELNLTRMHFQDSEDDTAALLRSPYLSPRLARLDLSGSCTTLANVERLAGCQSLGGLRWLDFGWNHLNPEKMKTLLQSPHLRRLEALHLSSMPRDEELQALTELARSRDWPRLRDVAVGSDTEQEAIEALSQRFGPRLRVWVDC